MSIHELDVLKSSAQHRAFRHLIEHLMTRSESTREEALYAIAFRLHVKDSLQLFEETTNTSVIRVKGLVSFDDMHTP